jgi:hypothetical protein
MTPVGFETTISAVGLRLRSRGYWDRQQYMITQAYFENGPRRNPNDGFQYESETARPNRKHESRREEHVGMDITHGEEQEKKLKRRGIREKGRERGRGLFTRGTKEALKRNEKRIFFFAQTNSIS